MSELMKLNDLCKSYSGKVIFDKVNLTIGNGHIIGVLGKNGVGKSTLIKLLGNMIPTDDGEILFEEQPIKQNSLKDIAYMLEPDNLLPWMRVKDVLDFGKDCYYGLDLNKAKRICNQLNISEKDKISKMSKGNKERVCLMLALARNAKLYLLDEPAGGMDASLKADMKRFILENITDDATVLFSTHLLKDFEFLYDQILIIKDGQIIFRNTDDIREQDHKTVEQYYMEVTGNGRNN